MIQPANHNKIQSSNSISSEKQLQPSVLGFIVNIVIVLVWTLAMAFSWYNLAYGRCDIRTTAFLYLLLGSAENLFAFHLFVMIDPEYGNKKETTETNVVEVLKSYWAIFLGTTLVYMTVTYVCYVFMSYPKLWEEKLFANVFISVALMIYAVAGMICIGFVTSNRKNILARIVRPWQVYEQEDFKLGRV